MLLTLSVVTPGAAQQSRWWSPVVADSAMVVSAKSEATRVGLEILRQGGNAADAAIAVHFALAVTLPYAGNIAPDDHPNHKGAWPADVFYGEMNGTWTDESVNNIEAELLQPYNAIVIVGPGTARTEFAGYLSEHQPKLAKRVWGIEPMDHPTDPQIVAAVRKFFHAADRMHS